MDHIQYINGKKPTAPDSYPVQESLMPDCRLRRTLLYIVNNEARKKTFGLNADESIVKPVENRFDFFEWGMTKDLTTGLMWCVKDIRALNISQADLEFSRVNNIASVRFEGWRLPTVDKFLIFAEIGKTGPGLVDRSTVTPSVPGRLERRFQLA